METAAPHPPAQAGPLRIAHLVNCFAAPQGSEWEWVQAVTVASMLRAQAEAKASGRAEVLLLSAQFEDDRAAVPAGLQPTPDLGRSMREVLGDPALPRLPLIADLLQRLYEASDAEYLLYTNVDIGLQPQFYLAVADMIAQGHDAFVINRRRIPGHYRRADELPQMYAERGLPHPGFDCFVFHRDLFPRFRLGLVCIGIPYIEILMGQNLFCHARSFRLVEDAFLTFHIGEEVFKPRHPVLLQANRRQFWQTVEELWPLLDSRKFPYGDRWLLSRLWKWGLHPCIPIRLCLRLEPRRWLRMRGR